MRTYKNFLFVGALAFLLGVQGTGLEDVFTVPVAHAAGMIDTAPLMEGVTVFLGFMITAMNVLMWVLFRLLDLVLDPVFIFDLNAGGADGPLLDMLHEIWQLTRDIMNIIFAILLVVGAVMTIIKADMELVKSYRAKFVLSIILINFSWFIPRVILDVSQVLTYTVYQIPSLMVTKGIPCRVPGSADGTIPSSPCVIVTDVKFLEETAGIVAAGPGAALPHWECPIKAFVCVEYSAFNNPTVWDHNPVLNGLIINHARLGILAHVIDPRAGGAVKPAPGTEIRELMTFLIRAVIVLLIHIALFFPMLALVVAFFIRIPILWITMAFMPVAFLGFVIGDKIPNFNPVEKIWKKFITVALLPAIVAIPLTVGFVMINAGTSIPAPPGVGGTIIPILADVKDIWQILWMLMALGVMWIGVFAALKQDEFIGKIVEPIKGYGEMLGKAALKAPLAAPILPIGAGMSPLQLLKMPRNFAGGLESSGRLDGGMAAATGGGTPEVLKARETAKDKRVDIELKVKGKIDGLDKLKADDIDKELRVIGENVRDMKLPGMEAMDPQKIVEHVLATPGVLSEELTKKLQKALEESKKS